MMKGNLEKTGNKWFVRYDVNDNVFRLPLHPNFVEMTDFVYIRGDRFYDGYEIEFTEVLVNPMGRDVDSKNLGQNYSLCKWYARPYLGEKEDLAMEVPMAQYLKEEPKQEYICYKCKNKTNNKFEICDKCNVGWKEPKQETLEEAARRLYYTVGNEGISSKESFINGTKWQQERSYSEEEVDRILRNFRTDFLPIGQVNDLVFNEWFKQFKKK